ncbi:MAG TPA: hypothetical protein VHV52_02250 [Gaiellaceae bacterium]|nr:hypothetical protein [Gaiellaceae bacterium]
MTRLVLVHGSVTNGARSWRRQARLAERFELVTLQQGADGFLNERPPHEAVVAFVDAA